MRTEPLIQIAFVVVVLVALLVAISGYTTDDDSLFQLGISSLFVLTLVGGLVNIWFRNQNSSREN